MGVGQEGSPDRMTESSHSLKEARGRFQANQWDIQCVRLHTPPYPLPGQAVCSDHPIHPVSTSAHCTSIAHPPLHHLGSRTASLAAPFLDSLSPLSASCPLQPILLKADLSVSGQPTTVGQRLPVACFCAACKLRMVFTFLHFVFKQNKENHVTKTCAKSCFKA